MSEIQGIAKLKIHDDKLVAVRLTVQRRLFRVCSTREIP